MVQEILVCEDSSQYIHHDQIFKQLLRQKSQSTSKNGCVLAFSHTLEEMEINGRMIGMMICVMITRVKTNNI